MKFSQYLEMKFLYYFLNALPQEVNAQLRSLMDRIEITPNHIPRIIWDNSSR